MTYLVHIWFDAAYKKGVGGTQSGHQGMKRVLKDISNKRIRIETAEERLFSPNIFLYVCVLTHEILNLQTTIQVQVEKSCVATGVDKNINTG